MTIYEVKYKRVDNREETFSYYFKSLGTALDYVGENYRFGVHSKLHFMDEVESNCSNLTFLPDFEGEARAAKQIAYPYYVRVLDVI